MLGAVKTVHLQKVGERFVAGGFGFALREHGVEKSLNHPAQLGPSAAGGAEFVQLGATKLWQSASVAAEKLRDNERIITSGHQRFGGVQNFSERALLIDRKII